MAVTHAAVAVTADDGTSEVGTDEWNANHTIGDNTVTLAKLATQAAGTYLANATAAAAVPTAVAIPFTLDPNVLAGALAWSQDPQVCTGNRTPAAALIYLTKIAVPFSITFTNISVSVITAGTSYTNAQVGLYSSAGVYLTASAVQASAGTNGFGSTGWRTFALGAAQAITGSPTAFVWAGVHFGTNGTTACNMSTSPASGLLVGSGLLTASTARTGSYTGHATNSLATIGNLTPSSITLVDRVFGILVT